MLESVNNIHLVGVGGIGMSGLAILLAASGRKTSGCDLKISQKTARWLAKAGVDTATGHSPEHIRIFSPDLVVRTPAVPDDAPELDAARNAGIPIASRGEVLAEFSHSLNTIAICGTHGKTSTSCFTATLLRILDKSRATGWCIGGWTDSLASVASPPDPDAPFVIEADESDGTLALYSPNITVVTSIERDHMEHFDSFDSLANCFKSVCTHTSKAVIFCADEANAARAALSASCRTIGYGFSESAALRACDPVFKANYSTFTVRFGTYVRHGIRLSVPGAHNVLNALGAIAACIASGYDIENIIDAISVLDSLPHRRFERYHCRFGFDLISDYSHHPTEIRALLETAKLDGCPITAIFQPHRYSRTKAFVNEFALAFSSLGPSDRLILLPVYPAFEQPLEGGETADLYARMRELNAAGTLATIPALAKSIDEVRNFIAVGGAGKDSLVLVIGAGDIVSLTGMLRCLRAVNHPTAPAPLKVSLGVSATADNFVEIHTTDELASALRNSRKCRVIGGGSNLLPPPLGVRETVIRLAANAVVFDAPCPMPLPQGYVAVTAECGISGASLLAELARHGLSGLEFMAGIPGTLGGWLAMNAGTRLGSISDVVILVNAFNCKGEPAVASTANCGFSYRTCRWLKNKIAFSAILALRRDSPDAILTRMRLALEKRFNFAGLRTAGSAFKNPPGAYAGEILERAGCKGLRVGGAFVSSRHANIVATDPGATASDVHALLALMRRRAKLSSDIDLQLEIKSW